MVKRKNESEQNSKDKRRKCDLKVSAKKKTKKTKTLVFKTNQVERKFLYPTEEYAFKNNEIQIRTIFPLGKEQIPDCVGIDIGERNLAITAVKVIDNVARVVASSLIDLSPVLTTEEKADNRRKNKELKNKNSKKEIQKHTLIHRILRLLGLQATSNSSNLEPCSHDHETPPDILALTSYIWKSKRIRIEEQVGYNIKARVIAAAVEVALWVDKKKEGLCTDVRLVDSDIKYVFAKFTEGGEHLKDHILLNLKGNKNYTKRKALAVKAAKHLWKLNNDKVMSSWIECSDEWCRKNDDLSESYLIAYAGYLEDIHPEWLFVENSSRGQGLKDSDLEKNESQSAPENDEIESELSCDLESEEDLFDDL